MNHIRSTLAAVAALLAVVVFAGLKAIDYRDIFLFEDGRGENPDEWIRLAAEFPRSFVARWEAH